MTAKDDIPAAETGAPGEKAGRSVGRGLLASTSVVGGMTLLSRILGLVRDIVFARFFGAGVGMDVFVVAFQIPNFLRRLFAEGAFSQAFVPVLADYKEQGSAAAVKALVIGVAGVRGRTLLLITGLTIWLRRR